MLRPAAALLVLASVVALAGCDETDAVAVRLHLKEDFTGTVRTSGIAIPPAEGAVQQASAGIDCGSRVEMICATGNFSDVNKLKVCDITFAAGNGGQGIGYLQVTIPRGPDVRWPKAFVPLDDAERKSVAGALDPSGKADSVGATIKLEVELPSAVVGNGFVGKARGTKTTMEAGIATIVVPLDVMSTPGDPLVWHMTWQR
jgi:hypothetical protein